MTDATPSLNLLGTPLEPCSLDPMTGFFRDGCCETGPHDHGSHTVCAVMTDRFLRFTLQQGNDLSTPRPEYDFPGLKAGDSWCLCASRWYEAFKAGYAPGIRARATNEAALRLVPKDVLLAAAVDLEGVEGQKPVVH